MVSIEMSFLVEIIVVYHIFRIEFRFIVNVVSNFSAERIGIVWIARSENGYDTVVLSSTFPIWFIFTFQTDTMY